LERLGRADSADADSCQGLYVCSIVDDCVFIEHTRTFDARAVHSRQQQQQSQQQQQLRFDVKKIHAMVKMGRTMKIHDMVKMGRTMKSHTRKPFAHKVVVNAIQLVDHLLHQSFWWTRRTDEPSSSPLAFRTRLHIKVGGTRPEATNSSNNTTTSNIIDMVLTAIVH
jgi:hypothetical protein